MSREIIDIKKCIRIEKYYPPNGNGGPKNQYIFKCKTIGCINEFKIKAKMRLRTASGLCVKCNNIRFQSKAVAAVRLKPYESSFNRIKDSAVRRNTEFDLKYEEFLTLVDIKKCHYCATNINRKVYGQGSYSLDRKNNDLGYTITNIVVCCKKCNKGKRELYSYEEWYGMTAYFRDRISP